MAIYEYRCTTCGARLEVMQPMGAAPLPTCGEECVKTPKKKSGKLERLFSAVNIGGKAGSSSAPATDDPSCGRCGRVGPDVCEN